MPSAETTTVERFLDAARRRADQGMAITGASIGLAVAALLTIVGWPIRDGLGPLLLLGALAGVGGGLRWALLRRASRRSVAVQIESRVPACRNLLVTASELLEGSRVDPYVAALVYEQAAALTVSFALPAVLPNRAALQRLMLAAAVWGSAVTWRATHAEQADAMAAQSGPPAITDVTVVITPPAYLGLAPRTVSNPGRIEAVAGSRLSITVNARAAAVRLETLAERSSLARSGKAFVGSATATADGFIAFEPAGGDGQLGDRRLIGLTVLADLPPTVVVRTPGRDLHFPDGARTVSIAIDANDDHGLASLKLRATTVSGSGERFSFAERDVPISITRQGAGRWTASTSWRLAALGLEPGDMVVYRAVATDHRPGATPVESDAWIVEITAPGSLAASGFAIDPEQNRYALSQQMVILKTERLLAGKARLTPEAFADSAAQIGMEQRRVRAEFVFMMGGEVDDGHGHDEEISQTELNEVAEAEGEDELAAGRLLNAGRLALIRGIRDMSRAATLLGTNEVPGALIEERKALAQIEQAFSHSRIILRALTQRESLDFSRRLSGALADAASSAEAAAPPPSDAKRAATRQLLAALVALPPVPSRASIGALAEAALRIDPADARLQAIASGLTKAADDAGRGETVAAAQGLDRMTTRLSTLVGASAPRAMTAPSSAESRRLRGSLADGPRAPTSRQP
ncbi:MAG: hypothetical protein IPG05_09145 [Gemmatimonadetes bacterium]|nr:hypothetical protein [Gemmatimonadota bacterium]